MSLARGCAMSLSRNIDLRSPTTWEFSGFSQNGEDGIIDVLARYIIEPNWYFIEVGASDGLENNTAWLSIARRYSGMWIEADKDVSDMSKRIFSALNYGVESVPLLVTLDNVQWIVGHALTMTPDLLSLDIDGNDYHIAERFLKLGGRPKLVAVEYNSAFGPESTISVPYRPANESIRGPGSKLYYGCSIGAWRKLFTRFGYSFVTVDRNGVNAFFADRSAVNEEFLKQVAGRAFAENMSQLREYRTGWKGQFELVQDREFFPV